MPPLAPPPSGARGNGTFRDLTSVARLSVLANRATNRDKKMGGRNWPAASIDALFRGFALYWLSWNAMIEPVADSRFAVESADYVALCVAASVPRPKCVAGIDAAKRAAKTFETGKHGGDTLAVTWDRVGAVDAELAARVWSLARRYGYDRDPPKRAA